MHEKKLVLIMRHGKSDRFQFIGDDFGRPLSQSGLLQPKIIAKQLNQLRIIIDRAVVSPAKRTVDTWTLLEESLSQSIDHYLEPKLYNASCQEVLDVLKDYAHQCDCLLLIAHNPSVIEVTEFLSGKRHDFKTGDLAILSSRSDDLSTGLVKPHQFLFEAIILAEE